MNVCNNTCASPAQSWETIAWQKVIYLANRLQRRIAKSVKQGRWNRAKALFYLLTKSFYAKLLAVFRVTNNKGGSTAGVDGVIWANGFDKLEAAKGLTSRGYHPQPLRRIYIPKRNGKKRPLSIPTLKDRAMQALFQMGLDPIAETTADVNSYGFRLKRSCADAIQQCFLVLAKGYHAQWILEADIKSCFDEISHQWLLKNIPMPTTILQKFLKAGYIENQTRHATHKGTPQGGIISPVLMNMTLDGLEKLLRKKFPRWKAKKVNFIRYADDFVITSACKETLENEVRPLVEAFLKERSLRLSPEKTRITHINEGFDFLSQNVRKYKGKLLIRPSKESVQSFKDKIKKTVKENRGIPAHALIRILNPIIRGWSNYQRKVCSKRTFQKLGHFIFKQLWRWAKHRHGNKNRRWIFNRYFTNNHFSDTEETAKGKKLVHLYRIAYVPIKYHKKIKGIANPYLPKFDDYFKEQARIKQQNAKELKQKMLSLDKIDNSNQHTGG